MNPETDQSKIPVGSSVSGKGKLTRIILLVFSIGLVMVILVGWGYNFHLREQYTMDGSFSEYSPKHASFAAKVDSSGMLQIQDGGELSFPSGAVMNLENSALHFADKTGVLRDEKLLFGKKLKVYANGYLHSFEGVSCTSEMKSFGDYSHLVTTGCVMHASVVRAERPTLTSYQGVSMSFRSVPTKKISRFQRLQNDPFILVSVPYYQISKEGSDGRVGNVVSPVEDTVSVYTNYGRSDFRFTAEELDQKKEHVMNAGPLSIHLTPQGLDCEPPYKLGDGKCYTLEWKGTNSTSYNSINFALTIDEQGAATNTPLLLDLEPDESSQFP